MGSVEDARLVWMATKGFIYDCMHRKLKRLGILRSKNCLGLEMSYSNTVSDELQVKSRMTYYRDEQNSLYIELGNIIIVTEVNPASSWL